MKNFGYQVPPVTNQPPTAQHPTRQHPYPPGTPNPWSLNPPGALYNPYIRPYYCYQPQAPPLIVQAQIRFQSPPQPQPFTLSTGSSNGNHPRQAQPLSPGHNAQTPPTSSKVLETPRSNMRFTEDQVKGLRESYQKNNKYIHGNKKELLARELGLTESQVAGWFSWERTREKRKQK